MSDLIEDIEKIYGDFHLRSVKLFVPCSYSLYSLAAASALSSYLNNACHITTTLVAYQEYIDEVSMCLPLAENPDDIPINSNDFIAVMIDCSEVEECDNDA